jgi:hypothetical protein
MKKIIYTSFLTTLFLLISFTFYLSTFGIETSKFNNIIIKEIKKKDPNIKLQINKIKVKFDVRKFQIYLKTLEPQIIYQDVKIPIKEINIYSKIISILKSKNEINQAIILIENFNIQDLQKLVVRM